jgi:hypothetical protein
MIATTSTTAPIVELEPRPRIVPTDDDAVRRLVRLALAGNHHPRPNAERRQDHRNPYPYPVYVTPLDSSGAVLADETISVIGRHLAERGIDFYYHQPVTHRRVVVSLAGGYDQWLGLLTDLTWCRFNRHGWYENGGRFLRVVPSPVAART